MVIKVFLENNNMTSIPSKRINKSYSDIILTFFRQALSGILQLCLTLIVGYSLGVGGVGQFTVATLLPTVMVQLFSFGIASALVYYVSSSVFSPQAAWSAGRDLTAIVALFGTFIGALVILYLGDFVFPGVGSDILFAALWAFPFMLMFNCSIGLLQAQQDFRALNFVILSQSIFALFCFIAATFWGFVGVKTFVNLVVLSHIFSFFIALNAVNKHVNVLQRTKDFRHFVKPALLFGTTAHASNVITFLNYRLDVTLVNILAGTAAAGLYSVSVRIVEQLWVFSTAFVTVVFPKMASMGDSESERKEYTAYMGRSVFLVTLAAALCLATFVEPIIRTFFGEEFLDCIRIIYIFLPGVITMSLARVLAHDLAARGMVAKNLIIAIFALIINIVGNILLIPIFGVYGAAIATSISYLTMCLLQIYKQPSGFLTYFIGLNYFQRIFDYSNVKD